MIYCTCAFSAEENELVVDYLLSREPGAELLEPEVSAANTIRGLTSWRGKPSYPPAPNRLSA
jgi:16S rRNA (cytosine1407-C5)-methyltransferase